MNKKICVEIELRELLRVLEQKFDSIHNEPVPLYRAGLSTFDGHTLVGFDYNVHVLLSEPQDDYFHLIFEANDGDE